MRSILLTCALLAFLLPTRAANAQEAPQLTICVTFNQIIAEKEFDFDGNSRADFFGEIEIGSGPTVHVPKTNEWANQDSITPHWRVCGNTRYLAGFVNVRVIDSDGSSSSDDWADISNDALKSRRDLMLIYNVTNNGSCTVEPAAGVQVEFYESAPQNCAFHIYTHGGNDDLGNKEDNAELFFSFEAWLN